MEHIKEYVKIPHTLKEEHKQHVFKEIVKPDLDKIPVTKRKDILFDLVIYLCSLVELYYIERNKGAVKKQLVLEVLNSWDTNEALSRMIELALESNKVVRKTLWKRAKLWLKKKVLRKRE